MAAMLENDDRAALMARLRPLFAALPDAISLPDSPRVEDWPTSDTNTIFWIKPRYWPTPGLRDRFETLELFALLARADWELWRHTVCELWPYGARDWDEIFEQRGSFTVGIDVLFPTSGRAESIFEYLLANTRLCDSSPAFVQAKRMLMARMQMAWTPTTIPVRLSRLPGNPADETPTYILKILQLLVTQRFLESNEHAHIGDDIHPCLRSGGLQIQELHLSAQWPKLEAAPLRGLLAIAAQGVAVYDLPCISGTLCVQSPELYVRSLWAFYGVAAASDREQRPPPITTRGVTKAVVDVVMPQEMLSGVYLALHASHSIKEVLMTTVSATQRPGQALRRLNWQWMAYALFYRPSQCLQELTLPVQYLRVADVATIVSLLELENPLAALLDLSDNGGVYTITASRFFLFDPAGGENQQSCVREHALSGLVVIQHSDTGWGVLLPGWGPAWVRTTDVLDFDTNPLPVYSICSIPHLVLTDVSRGTMDAALALLRVVGKDLVRLHVDAFRSRTTFDDWCCHVLLVCPRLEELDIHLCELGSVQVFLDGYASGWCRLRRLRVATPMHPSVLQLLRALSDKHPATRFLSELVWQIWAETTLDQAILDEAILMLERNSRLVVFTWKIQANAQDVYLLTAHVATLLRFDGSRVAGYPSPREKRQRLAFISVATTAHRTTVPHVVGLLDAAVLSLIFQLSATRRMRRVKVIINGYTLNHEQEWVAEGRLI